MIAKFGVATFKQGIEDLLGYAEAQARAIVRRIPNGAYQFADYMDEDAVDGKPCRLNLVMTVKDGSLDFDFTGSDPQLESSLNIPTGGDERHTLLCVGLVLCALFARPDAVPELRHCAHPVLDIAQRDDDQSAVSGGGGNAHAVGKAAARRHSRRVRAGAAGRDAGGIGVWRADHEHQHH